MDLNTVSIFIAFLIGLCMGVFVGFVLAACFKVGGERDK